MMLRACFMPLFQRRRRQPRGGGGGGDVGPGGLKIKLATILTMFFHAALFLLIISTIRLDGLMPLSSPVMEGLLRITVVGAFSIAFYCAIFFAFGELFWGLPMRVLLTHHYMLIQLAAQFSRRSDELTWAVLYSSIAFMFYILILQ